MNEVDKKTARSLVQFRAVKVLSSHDAIYPELALGQKKKNPKK
jgi:hypothetical protein